MELHILHLLIYVNLILSYHDSFGQYNFSWPTTFFEPMVLQVQN